MKRLPLAILALSIAVAGTANAQIPGNLTGKAKKAIEKKLSDKDKEADEQQASDKSGSRPPANKDAGRKYAPGLSYSSVLNGLQMLAKNGGFSLHHIQATFLPEDYKEGFSVLRTADGKEIYRFDWKPQILEKPYALLDNTKTTDLATGETPPGAVPLTTPGDYVLDFYLPTEHFYSFPFSVVKIAGDDPFGPGECYTLDGDWRDWGYLYYSEARPDQSLQWKAWLRNDGCEEKPLEIRIEITRDQDGELVCTSRENTTYKVQPKWIRFEFDMVFPKGKEVPHGTYFKAQDLLETDGAYTLNMKLDGQPYGTWRFAVQGGKFNYTGRTLRGETDPLTFIEGGRDAWWYAREK
ncbi:MAG TPA: hypothetical protein VM243_15480 [Phycisphaerae bacterium]|nr:hypothetical protein [Phycisphaerae bacterium]